MSWIQKLYETYELQPKSLIGKVEGDASAALLPICHTTNKVQIEIAIDENGKFIDAKVIDEATIIPCTEESSGRAGKKPVNHPLCDKLQYVAGDFSDYGGEVTSGFSADPQEPYRDFCALLEAWEKSSSNHPKVSAVYKYVKQGRLIQHLVKAKILYLDSQKKIMNKWDGGDPIPPIFKVFSPSSAPEDAFVRWVVRTPGAKDSTTWTDKSLRDSWIEYYLSTRIQKDVCFVTGKKDFLASQHASKIRNAGDKAKLISSNDGSGFTYRGRFIEPEQAAGVSLKVSQEAHNALRWLIARQGYRDGDLALVAWRTAKNVEAPNPMAGTYDFISVGQASDSSSNEVIQTGQHLAEALKKKTAGYHAEIGATKDFVVMGLDSATPGRMAITFYRELTGSDYLTRIEQWHLGCAWPQNFGKDKHFTGAPAPKDIAEACYGLRLDEKLRKATIERLLPCIIDGQPLPLDLVQSSVRRACNRVGLEAWEWEKVLGIACALYRKYHEKEGYEMGLDKERHTRDYLYGRLLAVADVLEGRALWKAGETRPTTAARLMQRFSDHPCSTWKTIELALGPYKARLGGSADWFTRLIDEIKDKFKTEDFIDNKNLSGEFLLGYHCQRADLLRGGKPNNDDESETETSTDQE
jgi:CRISPR-associated protein Csd1